MPIACEDGNKGGRTRPASTRGPSVSGIGKMINSEFPNDPEILARVGAITSQLLKDLPNESEQRGQTILERALRYAAETEQRIADQLERIAELENLSFTDPMTGLLNRRGFEKQFSLTLARSRRYGETGVIAYFDLDNLKEVNDRLGHGAGDELVKCCAQTLSRAVREIDTVGRLGGDEFCVLLVNTGWQDGVRRMRTLQWILDSAGTVSRGEDIPLKVSMGYEPYGAQDSVDDLIHRADMAMYYNKRRKHTAPVQSAAE